MPNPFSRRDMLAHCGVGMGMLGLQTLLSDSRLLASEPLNPLAPKAAPLKAKVKLADRTAHRRCIAVAV
jgi:hypothetical protein